MSDGAVKSHRRRQERNYEMKERRWEKQQDKIVCRGALDLKSSQPGHWVATFGRRRQNSRSVDLRQLHFSPTVVYFAISVLRLSSFIQYSPHLEQYPQQNQLHVYMS
jgi:hypothetical protein